MAGRGSDAAQTFLAGVLAKLSPEDRVQGETAWRTLQALGGGTVASAIGDGTLAQAEFSRLSDDLRTQQETLVRSRAEVEAEQQRLNGIHDAQLQWFEANSAALEEYQRMRASGTPTPTPTPTPSPTPAPAGFTEEHFNERIAAERAAFLGFQRDENALLREHFSRFQEVLDLEPLLQHPQIRELGLKGAYQLVHKDRLAQHATAAAAAVEEKIRADERAKVLASQASMPYPSPTGVGSGSPLDALAPAGQGPVVDAAVTEYLRLQQARAGSPFPS